MERRRLFTIVAQGLRRLGAIRFMNAALQSAYIHTNFPQHGGREFCMDWFAVVRPASECYFLFCKTEMISSAGSHERNCLEWFRRRTEKSYVIRKARISCEKSIT